jgi:uncharacterized phage-associated protein
VTVSAHDVARELRERMPSIGVLKLHKLLYLVQAWHLAFTGRPLFRERVEAWAQGPVVATLWADERYARPQPEQRGLSGVDVATIDYVIARYGRMSGADLKELTHREGPWRDLSDSDEVPGSAEITPGAMREFFERDPEFVAHMAEVARIRKRAEVYSFDALPRTPDLEAAIARAASGVRVRQTRG